MPVHVKPQGSRFCVAEPDGSVVDGGCHDLEDDAIAHMQAININTRKVMGVTGNDMPTEIEVLEVETLEVEIVEDDAIDEKGMPEFVLDTGPTTFAELSEAREVAKQRKSITTLLSDFMTLAGNALSSPGSAKNGQVKALAKELADMIPGEEEEEDSEEEEKGVSINVDGSNLLVGDTSMEIEFSDEDLVYIWKDAAGTYRWVGVYSNKFRDNDSPAEILAEKAHLQFIERVEKGVFEYPDLYIWHIPSAIGKADLLAYDDAGFSVVAGTLEEDFAIALMESKEDLAMSHGMPVQYIRRDKEDPTIIVEYASIEVSILPRYAAANKMTEFVILKDEEETMTIIPEGKRQQVTNLLGENLTERLEAGILASSEKAIADGIEYKEEAEVEEATTEEAGAEIVEEPEIVEEVAEEVAEAEGEVSDSTDVDGDTVEKGNDNESIANTLAAIVDAVTASQAQVIEAVKALTERIDNMESSVEQLESDDEAKIVKLAAETPAASLEALLLQRLGHPVGSIIGSKEAQVHGNSSLANAKPLETEVDEKETEGKNAGLFFNKWRGN